MTRKTDLGSKMDFNAEKQPCFKLCDDAFWIRKNRVSTYSQLYQEHTSKGVLLYKDLFFKMVNNYN